VIRILALASIFGFAVLAGAQEPKPGPVSDADVETDAARQVDGGDEQLDGSWIPARHLEEGAHDLRLRVAEHEDLDLVLRVPETANELGEDPLGERGELVHEGSVVVGRRHRVLR
jgi:hypothetical protein